MVINLKQKFYPGIFLLLMLILLFKITIYSETIENLNIKIIELTGAITPAISDYIVEEINKNDCNCIIIKLDTPGGLLDSMKEIVQAILNTNKLIIVWVYPSGATAASAGTFITLASDIAVMAPNTQIGAASPVSLGGEGKESESKTMEKKVMNFSISYIKTLAEKHNRNVEWAVKAVKEAESITSEEAYKLNVIDFIASDLNDIFNKINGKKITKNNNTYLINKNKIIFFERKTPLNVKIRKTLSNPNIAYIFLILGVLAFIYEFSSPGVGFGLISGILFLSLAFYSLSVFPINFVAVILVILGIVMIILDIFIPSHGLLTIGGVIILAIGSNFIINLKNPLFKISLYVIIPVIIFFVLFSIFVIKKLLDLRKKKPITGEVGIINKEGEVKSWDKKSGIVFVRGEYWIAKSGKDMQELEPGQTIVVIGIDGNKLIVKPKDD